MSGIDYEELIRSPLDDLDEQAGNDWVPAAIGAVIGLLLGYLLTVGLGGGEGEPAAATSSTTTTTTAPVAPADYPSGFDEVAPGLAASSDEIILGDEVITVAFTTAVKRGDDPAETAWPVGGNWVLEGGSGTVVESSRVVIGRFSPGAFAVQFPAAPFNDEAEFVETSVVERWDLVIFTGSIEIPFDGEPFTAPETLTLPVSQEVALIVSNLELGRFLGSVEWQTTGADFGTTVEVAATLLDANADVIGSYRRFPEALDPNQHGVIEILWSEPFPTSQEGAVAVSLDYTVGVVRETPVSIDFDLSGVPIGR